MGSAGCGRGGRIVLLMFQRIRRDDPGSGPTDPDPSPSVIGDTP